MNNSSLYIATFSAAALWDVALNYTTQHYDKLPHALKHSFPFIGYLIPYFQKHTVLAAALIAGFVGATAQMIVMRITRFPPQLSSPSAIGMFLIVSFVVSALYGYIMKLSRLFPVLEATYYRRLESNGGVVRSMYHDGISGLIVQVTLLVIYAIFPALAK